MRLILFIFRFKNQRNYATMQFNSCECSSISCLIVLPVYHTFLRQT